MKKKLILAALIAAAVTATAQMTQNDSIALLYRSLAQTNAELARVTQQTRTTAMLVGVGGVSMIAGTAFALAATSHDAIETGSSETLAKVGTGFAIAVLDASPPHYSPCRKTSPSTIAASCLVCRSNKSRNADDKKKPPPRRATAKNNGMSIKTSNGRN